MTFAQLQHAIRAACDIAGDTELWVFGSQAILSEFPEAPESIVAFREKDRNFIRTLIIEELIDHKLLAERIQILPVETDIIDNRLRWLYATIDELSQS